MGLINRTHRGCRALLACLLLMPGAAVSVPVVPDGYAVELFAQRVGAVTGLAMDDQGNLYAADYDGGRILKLNGPADLDIYASGIDKPTDLAFDADGRLYVASSTSSRGDVFEVLADGSTSLFASGFSFPTSIEALGGEFFVSNSGDGTMSRIDNLGNDSVFLSGLSAPNGPYGISLSDSGQMYFIDHGSGTVYGADALGNRTQLGKVTALGGTFTGIGFGGRLFISDVNLGALMFLNDQNVLETFATGFAGKGNAPFIGPNDFVFDGGGNMFVGDADKIWRITAHSVPEPISALLITLGLIGLSASRKSSSDDLNEGVDFWLWKRTHRLSLILRASDASTSGGMWGVNE